MLRGLRCRMIWFLPCLHLASLLRSLTTPSCTEQRDIANGEALVEWWEGVLSQNFVKLSSF